MKLINADCIEAMKAMPDNSVDSIVTDPPYELGFMGKSWDASGIAFNIEVWREALRVIKPGGHLIAFSGSRTYHRMAVAIEDAGFQIRDQIMWVYGSGFPKSHNISKGIDKAAGAEREVIGKEKNFGASKASEGKQAFGDYAGEWNLTAPNTKEAQQWDGWGTALKPAHEPMVLARKPLEGTVANNVLTFGVGGLNIDGSRVDYVDENDGGDWSRFEGHQSSKTIRKNMTENGQGLLDDRVDNGKQSGRFPANFIHDGSDEVVALFPTTSPSPKGLITQGGKASGGFDVGSSDGTRNTKFQGHGDSGSAARFFYCAKASKRDRNEGLDGFEAKKAGSMAGGEDKRENGRSHLPNFSANHHPTVKPTTLMQYLIRLVTPPNGIVLDPFMGSGSTGKACAYEGFDFIGIDQSAEYVAIAQARIDFALADKSDELPL
jgi:site-specific DNA-methyltransferase (adenine-specific)